MGADIAHSRRWPGCDEGSEKTAPPLVERKGPRKRFARDFGVSVTDVVLILIDGQVLSKSGK